MLAASAHGGGGGAMKTTKSKVLCAVAAALCASAALAQTYPARPITIIVPYATGGTTDLVARIMAHELTASLGRQVLVDNRTGGGGVVGWSAAARSAPDGYTVLAQELSYAI